MPITYRPGSIDDSFTFFQIFSESLTDLSARLNVMAFTGGADPQVIAEMWPRRQSLFEHLARTSDHCWVAEQDGQAIGYARSILRDGVRELTEFFLRPGTQSAGVGRELLARAFPNEGARHRSIIATTDLRAQALYLKQGVFPVTPIQAFWKEAQEVAVETDLSIEPVTPRPEVIGVMGVIDQSVLGYRRDVDHQWLMEEHQGYLYRRAGRTVGYGYTGYSNGPFAVLDPDDFPAVLAHAETVTAAAGRKEFVLEVPLINRDAVTYLLASGYQMDAFIAYMMEEYPLGGFTHYIFTSPPFFA
jgi:GNAT superfamily N-acetyltransferase